MLEAVAAALNDRLRLYPDPVATAFRRTAASLHGVDPDMVLAGNGSDDLLTIITRAFAGPGDPVLCPSPSYILYRTLVELQDARERTVPYHARLALAPRLRQAGAKLAFLANPNSPSGTALTPARSARWPSEFDGPLVVDEAYVDFADERLHGLVAEHPNVIVTRSFSKGYSLAGLRLGYLSPGPRSSPG